MDLEKKGEGKVDNATRLGGQIRLHKEGRIGKWHCSRHCTASKHPEGFHFIFQIGIAVSRVSA